MSGGTHWRTIAYVARMTGLSDETIRKFCTATPKRHFPSARLVDDRWEIPEDEACAARIIDRSQIVARIPITESRLTQLERLGKLACSGDGKFSLNQERYLHTVKTLADLASAPAFEERVADHGVTESRDPAAPDGATAPSAPAAAAPVLQQPGQPAQVSQPQHHTEVVFVRPEIALMDEWLAYMKEHKDPARLPDEFFAGEYAPDFIPPVGVDFHVAWGPGGMHDAHGQPKHTRVCRYPRWTLDGENLKWEAEDHWLIEGIYRRGSSPDEYAEGNAKYRMLRDLWNARVVEARARLKDRARLARVAFLPKFVWRPEVRNSLRRYQEERLHPSEFPDSVKAALIDVAFIPTHNMFFYESTGEVRIGALAWISTEPNWANA